MLVKLNPVFIQNLKKSRSFTFSFFRRIIGSMEERLFGVLRMDVESLWVVMRSFSAFIYGQTRVQLWSDFQVNLPVTFSLSLPLPTECCIRILATQPAVCHTLQYRLGMRCQVGGSRRHLQILCGQHQTSLYLLYYLITILLICLNI